MSLEALRWLKNTWESVSIVCEHTYTPLHTSHQCSTSSLTELWYQLRQSQPLHVCSWSGNVAESPLLKPWCVLSWSDHLIPLIYILPWCSKLMILVSFRYRDSFSCPQWTGTLSAPVLGFPDARIIRAKYLLFNLHSRRRKILTASQIFTF